ncbi:MAG: hypothetical protein Q8P41_18475 [Pseudomonadota bacterium]|nr:hypothetical protein [Pseudomonadota bacterium]
MLALTIGGRTERLPETERDAAMRRYFDAHQAGDTTAQLVHLEGEANGPMGPEEDPPPTAPGAVSATAQARIETQEAWLAKAGFALAPPLYAPGTRVLPVGDQNFRLERQRVETLPPFPGAASAVTAAIRLEARRDHTVHLRDLSMTEHGTLLVDGEEFAIEGGAFFQLAAHAGFGMGARYLAELCPSPRRALNVNAHLSAAKARQVTLRTRASEERELRQVYATVTPTYAAVDTDQVLGVVLRDLEYARTEMVYDGSGVRATALYMPDKVVDLAAGDIFKSGVRIETDDTGRGRIRISAVVWRNRCLNLLIIGEGVVDTMSQVHRGSTSKIVNAVAKGVKEARAKIGDFLNAWGHARSVLVDPETILRRWVDDKKVFVQGERDRDLVVQRLLDAWNYEPGVTLADAVNAVSRAAHETPTWSLSIREELERQAARLVLVPR